MKIIKVINNNTVSVIDDKGKEQIISGKGDRLWEKIW
ncbi:MAG: CAT RNA binding domain-containing protein [Ruminococcus sp.]